MVRELRLIGDIWRYMIPRNCFFELSITIGKLTEDEKAKPSSLGRSKKIKKKNIGN